MKKHQLLEKAMRDYPAGRYFNSCRTGDSCKSDGLFSINIQDGISVETNGTSVYLNGRWAECVSTNKTFFRKSNDGVDMYVGDEFYVPQSTLVPGVFYEQSSKMIVYQTWPKDGFYFHSKEVADKWIEKQKKPKFKEVDLFDGMVAHVYLGEILIKDADKTVTTLHPSDVEDMMQALKTLTP